MKRIPLLAVTFSTLLIAGTAFAQEGTTRGGARSVMPSTPQNSPGTGQTTGANPATGPNAAVRYKPTATTSGQAMGQAQMYNGKSTPMKKAKKSSRTMMR